jgi:hypothetical protein
MDCKILSYAIYELTGEIDLLLRLWIPPSVTQLSFENALKRALSDVHLTHSDNFTVNEIIAHWIWNDNGPGDMRQPSERHLKEGLSDSEIQRVNDGRITYEEFKWFAERNFLTPYNPSPGIKFAIRIPHFEGMTVLARNHLRIALMEIMRRSRHLKELSLYRGAGFGQFLLIGKVEPSHFENVNSELIHQINELGLGPIFGVRTITHIIVSSPGDSQTLQDRIPLKRELQHGDGEITIDWLFEREEDEALEFKGSAFSNLDRWLEDGGEPTDDKRVTEEGALRAIIGLLNAKGGRVVIGVLEAKRYKKYVPEALRGLPRRGEYIVCGVNVDYRGKSWDEFALRLQNIIFSSIIPTPKVWVSVKKEVVDGRDVCVVTVRECRSDWFYLKTDPNFYVRFGNSTDAMIGPNADEYKREKGR